MKREENRAWHECLRFEGTETDCGECSISDQGYCEEFRIVLRKMRGHLDSREHRALSLPDRDHILSITVESINRNIHTFEGKSKFSTWAWSIFKYKLIDFYKETKRQRKRFTHLSQILKDGTQQEEIFLENKRIKEDSEVINQREEVQYIIAVLKQNIGNDKKGCIQLFLDLYFAWEEGKNDYDVAHQYGLKPNTLTKKKIRCQETIQRLLED